MALCLSVTPEVDPGNDLTWSSPLGLAWILRNLVTEMPGFGWNCAHCKYR
jgi:hypothetical protein